MRSAIAILLLLVSPAFSRTPQTVMVRCQDDYGPSGSLGSGVIIGTSPDGRYRTVLTAAHVTGSKLGKRVWVYAGNGYQAQPTVKKGGALLGVNRAADTALVVIGNKGIEDVADAQLWLGQIDRSQTLRTEGFAGGTFMETRGRPRGKPSSPPGSMTWSAPSYSGMSGGPTYLNTGGDVAYVLTVLTGSDGTFSLGPYRTFVRNWVSTCDYDGWGFSETQGCIVCEPPGYGGGGGQGGGGGGGLIEPPIETQPDPTPPEECPPGPKGDKGDQGPQGPPGEDGKDAEITDEQIACIVATVIAQLKQDSSIEIDIDDIANKVQEKLDPIRFRLVGLDGKETEQAAHLGQRVNLNLKDLTRK